MGSLFLSAHLAFLALLIPSALHAQPDSTTDLVFSADTLKHTFVKPLSYRIDHRFLHVEVKDNGQWLLDGKPYNLRGLAVRPSKDGYLQIQDLAPLLFPSERLYKPDVVFPMDTPIYGRAWMAAHLGITTLLLVNPPTTYFSDLSAMQFVGEYIAGNYAQGTGQGMRVIISLDPGLWYGHAPSDEDMKRMIDIFINQWSGHPWIIGFHIRTAEKRWADYASKALKPFKHPREPVITYGEDAPIPLFELERLAGYSEVANAAQVRNRQLLSVSQEKLNTIFAKEEEKTKKLVRENPHDEAARRLLENKATDPFYANPLQFWQPEMGIEPPVEDETYGGPPVNQRYSVRARTLEQLKAETPGIPMALMQTPWTDGDKPPTAAQWREFSQRSTPAVPSEALKARFTAIQKAFFEKRLAAFHLENPSNLTVTAHPLAPLSRNLEAGALTYSYSDKTIVDFNTRLWFLDPSLPDPTQPPAPPLIHYHPYDRIEVVEIHELGHILFNRLYEQFAMDLAASIQRRTGTPDPQLFPNVHRALMALLEHANWEFTLWQFHLLHPGEWPSGVTQNGMRGQLALEKIAFDKALAGISEEERSLFLSIVPETPHMSADLLKELVKASPFKPLPILNHIPFSKRSRSAA